MSNEKMSADEVLAVLDQQTKHTRQFGGSPSFQTIESARTAVADLIAERDALRNALYTIKARCEIELGMEYHRNADHS